MSERDELVENLRYAHEHSQQRVWGSLIFKDAADQIERDGREIERLEAENAELATTLAECVFLLTGGRHGAFTQGGGPVANAVALLMKRAALNGDGE